jgi:hypothetical protein
MGKSDTIPWKWLESRTPTIFLVVGAWFVGYAGLKVIRLMTEIAVPDVVSVTVGHLGLLALALGLLGLYPQVCRAAPRLARAGAVTSVLSGVCSVILLVAVIQLTLSMGSYPAIPGDTAQGILPPFVGVVLLLISLLTILLGSLLFGVASMQTDSLSDPIGYLLLVPSIMWAMLFVMHATGVNGTLIGVIVYSPIAVAMLNIGYRLQTENAAPNRVQSSVDSPI